MVHSFPSQMNRQSPALASHIYVHGRGKSQRTKTLVLLLDGLRAIAFGGREFKPFVDFRCNRFGVDDRG